MKKYPPLLKGLKHLCFLFLAKRAPLKAYQYLARQGDLIGYKTAENGFCYLLSDPILVQQMLQDHEHFLRGTQETQGFIQGMFSDDGASWKHQRESATKSFRASTLLGFVTGMCDEVEDQIEALKKTNLNCVNFSTLMMQLTARVFAKTILGQPHSPELDAFVNDWNTVIAATAGNPLGIGSLLVNQVSTDDKFALGTPMSNIESFCKRIAEERKAAQIKPQDFLTCILSMAENCPHIANQKQFITDQILTFLIAGHETTSATLAHLFQRLGNNHEVQEQARKEADHAFGGMLSGKEQLDALQYTEWCVQETLRLEPAAYYLSRFIDKETILGEHCIPAKSRIDVCTYSLHRDKRHWEKPNCFYPERFNTSDKRFVSQHPAFLPFGYGPRRCIGDYFAKMEMKLIVGLFLKHFSIYSWKAKLGKQFQMILKPETVWVSLVER